MFEQLTGADFEALPDRRLNVAFGEATLELEIKEVLPLPPTRLRPAPFSLVLRAAGIQRSMPQGVYAYHHPRHGPLELFTVPLGPDDGGMCYEIVFN